MEDIDRLCELLGEETRVCGELSAVLREEQQAVVRLRPEAILESLERRETLQQVLLRLADDRRHLVRAVTARYGAETLQTTALLPLLPPEPRVRVRAQLRQLRRALLEARGLERQTELLVDASLDTMGELLRTLRGLMPGARYGADAELAVPVGSERVDRRA